MKKFKNLVKTTLLGISAILILFSMAVMVWIHAFPKDPEIEKWIPFFKERAEKRAEAIKAIQAEGMKQHK
ncbi:hypothetical protein ACFPA1_00080 [Neobacillus sp. GCM10023253]|uniref:hypothetical protein n=1 Tax=Neobacillus sp. GCM10023253 TaxID=3252644 RepID=UPI00361DFBA7